jgi:uncharacterized protein YjbI with pentapeptide repeats
MKHFKFALTAANRQSSLESMADRWKTSRFQALEVAVRQAVTRGEDIPADAPSIEVECDGANIQLVDLRGINLSGLTIGKVDLTYCCFDGADFQNSRFKGTLIQYSSFSDASLDGVEWDSVQASPISANRVSFRSARIRHSFLMRSSLTDAKFEDAEIENTALVGSLLGNSTLANAHKLSAVDISQVYLSSEAEEVALLERDGVSGRPVILPSEPQRVSPVKHASLRMAKVGVNAAEFDRFIQSHISESTYQHFHFYFPVKNLSKKLSEKVFVGKVVAENFNVVTVSLKASKGMLRNYSTKSNVAVAIGDIVEVVETRQHGPKKVKRAYVASSKKVVPEHVKSKRRNLVITRVIKSNRLIDGKLLSTH